MHSEHCLPCRQLLQYTKAALELLDNPVDESQIPIPDGLATRIKAGVRRAYDDSRVRETTHTPAIGSPAFTAVCASLLIGALVLYLGMTNWYGRTYDAEPQTPSPRLVIAQATHPMKPVVNQMDLFSLVQQVKIADITPTLPVIQKPVLPVLQKPAVQVAKNVTVMQNKQIAALACKNYSPRVAYTHFDKPVKKSRAISANNNKQRPAVLVSETADVVRHITVRNDPVPVSSHTTSTTTTVSEDTGMIAGLVASYMIESLAADTAPKPAMITSSATMTPHVVAITSLGAVSH